MPLNKETHFPALSFDGCGINGRDEYRTRLCTFAEVRGEGARHYGPLFANAPEILATLDAILKTKVTKRWRSENAALVEQARATIAKAEGRA